MKALLLQLLNADEDMKDNITQIQNYCHLYLADMSILTFASFSLPIAFVR